jgi:Chaperone for flagella basal body P-ring formation
MRGVTKLLLALALTSGSAHGEAPRVVGGTQVRLSELVTELPADVPDVEVGAAPPPGSSRTIARGEILDAAERSGVSLKGLRLPLSVRVTSAAKRWSTEELADAATTHLLGALPAGVTVRRARATAKAVTSPRASVSAVRVPKLPRREGEHLTTATIELSNDGQIVARVPLQLSLEIPASAAVAAVTKGSRVQLVIERGSARISATAVALTDGELGDTLQFRVATTQKILYGLVLDPTTAKVVQ